MIRKMVREMPGDSSACTAGRNSLIYYVQGIHADNRQLTLSSTQNPSPVSSGVQKCHVSQALTTTVYAGIFRPTVWYDGSLVSTQTLSSPSHAAGRIFLRFGNAALQP
jgi:hypothetical protein